MLVPLLYIAFVLAQLFDVLTTMKIVEREGLEGERIPWNRWLIGKFGFAGPIALKSLFCIGLAAVVFSIPTTPVILAFLVAANVLTYFIVLKNLMVLDVL